MRFLTCNSPRYTYRKYTNITKIISFLVLMIIVTIQCFLEVIAALPSISLIYIKGNTGLETEEVGGRLRGEGGRLEGSSKVTLPYNFSDESYLEWP